MDESNLILGAGPAGLFCAHQLAEHNESSIIIEKRDFVGGLAATHMFEGCTYEIGPHILFTEDEYIKEIARDYIGSDLIRKDWNVGQQVEGQLLEFPNTLTNMTAKLGLFKMLKFGFSFIQHQFKTPTTFTEFIYSKVGRKLAEFSVINYTEKMWGIPLDELETEWIKPRLGRFSIKEILKNTYRPKKRDYLYPRHGSGQLYTLMSEKKDVRMEEYPTRIKHDNQVIRQVITNKNQYAPMDVFSSIPIQELIPLFDPSPPSEITTAVKSLKHRSQIYVVLAIKKTKAIDYQWIYFNDRDIPFCRVHEPKNFSDIDSSPDNTLLVVEYFCFEQDEIWHKDDQNIIKTTIEHLSKLKLVNPEEVSNSKVIKQKYAYPLLNQNRQKNLKIINDYIGTLKNLHLIGRHGGHTYDNQDGAGRSAIDIVDTLKGR